MKEFSEVGNMFDHENSSSKKLNEVRKQVDDLVSEFAQAIAEMTLKHNAEVEALEAKLAETERIEQQRLKAIDRIADALFGWVTDEHTKQRVSDILFIAQGEYDNLIVNGALQTAPDYAGVEYTNEMSYYGGYSKYYRLVEVKRDDGSSYWIIAVKNGWIPDGEDVMYRIFEADKALETFVKLLDVDGIDDATLNLAADDDTLPVSVERYVIEERSDSLYTIKDTQKGKYLCIGLFGDVYGHNDIWVADGYEYDDAQAHCDHLNAMKADSEQGAS